MTAVLGSALILGGLGLCFGILIAIANHKLRVWEDPRVDAVTGLLPGTNCGACGFPGCRPFAEGLIGGDAQPAGCTVMGPEDTNDVAEYLGVEAGKVRQRVARLMCAGGTHVSVQRADYTGWSTCEAAATVAGGGKGCSWGCLGLADCREVCDLDAIYMDQFDLPVVIPELCTACGDCVDVCPKDLFEIMPMDHRLLVQCKNLVDGDDAEELCSVACTACRKCVADAQPGVIEILNGLAVVNYEMNSLAGAEAIVRCPTGAIVWLDGSGTQFQASRDLAAVV